MDSRGVTIGAMKGECLEETKHGFVSGRVVFGNFCHSTVCFVKRMLVKRLDLKLPSSVLRGTGRQKATPKVSF